MSVDLNDFFEVIDYCTIYEIWNGIYLIVLFQLGIINYGILYRMVSLQNGIFCVVPFEQM